MICLYLALTPQVLDFLKDHRAWATHYHRSLEPCLYTYLLLREASPQDILLLPAQEWLKEIHQAKKK